MYKLYRQIKLKVSKEQCWNFFSAPENLKVITPDYMGFDIIEGGGKEMYEGQIIAYTVSPLFNFKVKWVTEITHVRQGEFFVDEQRFGPYKFWHHKHFFEEIPGGVLCTDEIHYIPPFKVIAPLLNKLTIESKLKEIFDYREKVLVERFGRID